MFYSTHHSNVSSLDSLSISIRKNWMSGKIYWKHFSDEQKKLISGYLDHPQPRRMLELKSIQKRGLLQRAALGFHSVGPDGYQMRVVERGKDISKADFDALRAASDQQNVFVVSAYVDGLRKETAIPEDLWFAIKDIFSTMDRIAKPSSKLDSVLAAQAKAFTTDWLKAKGMDVTGLL